MFKGIIVQKDDSGYKSSINNSINESDLPEGDVLVNVQYSTLNYKDALAITGKGPVVRKFPMVPGIDFAGIVEESSHADYKKGDLVVLNGWGVGEVHWGALAEKARVNGDWLIPLADGFSSQDAMAIGTAGYTAMLAVMALERQGITPNQGDILVTGAGGGVGGIAVAILAKLGYSVVGMTGKLEASEYIKKLGAKEIIDRQEYSSTPKPLAKERWAGAIDVVGGNVLANVCAAMKHSGTVAVCGLAGGMDFPTTVAPLILRGITIVGVDSVYCPKLKRIEAWRRLARDLDLSRLKLISGVEIGLSDCLEYASLIMDSKLKGRVVVNINK